MNTTYGNGAAPPHVFWLFGLSGAGKTTLAERLRQHLATEVGEKTLLLDGDRFRHGLCKGLGFSQQDRMENLRRAAEVARIGLESGISVIAAFITPLEIQRAAVAKIIDPSAISMIYVQAALTVCQKRDVKGLYAKASSGALSNMTGLSSAFEPPTYADIILPTDVESPEQSSQRLITYAQQIRTRVTAA